MRRMFSKILGAIIMGVYFAEKGLPFPLKFVKKPEHVGTLELDLQVIGVAF
jgi:hypothetical protein